MRYYKNLMTGKITTNNRVAKAWIKLNYKVSTWKEKIVFRT